MKKVAVIGVLAALFIPALASAETPPQGVPLEVRRGFFTETDVGVFFTLGGDDAYSNAQTYVQLGVGYDITESLELGLHFGLGASAANCFAGRNTRGDCNRRGQLHGQLHRRDGGLPLPAGQPLLPRPEARRRLRHAGSGAAR